MEYNKNEVKKIFEEEIKKISKDPEIIEQSKEITKLMGTAKESEFLKESIQKNPLLVKQLSAGRKNILLSYLKSSSIDYNYWLEVVKKAKKELNLATKNFETAEEGLVDYYVYQIKASKSKVDFLVNKARDKGLSLNMIEEIYFKKNQVG